MGQKMLHHRRLRMGLIGGGGAGFIGKVHAIAAQLDNRAELVAGAFSSHPTRSQESADAFGVSPDRAYGSYEELFQRELQLPPEQRIDFVSIATPNHLHFPIAMAALDSGMHVVCEKPLTIDLAQAEQLARRVEQTGKVFVLLHNYTGYPLVRQARQMIAEGELGEIQAIRVQYLQGWLRGIQPGIPPARGQWKADPRFAGPAGALGDIGTHAYQLARYLTGLTPRDISCQLATRAAARQLDDYGQMLLRFTNGALGVIVVSQVTHGRLNDLSFEVDGTLGALSWRQEDPNQLFVRAFGQPTRIYDRHPAAPYMNDAGRAACRLPGGHPEAFFEAFANVFRAAFDDMLVRRADASGHLPLPLYPTVQDGVEGVFFIEQCLASHYEDGATKPLFHPLARYNLIERRNK